MQFCRSADVSTTSQQLNVYLVSFRKRVLNYENKGRQIIQALRRSMNFLTGNLQRRHFNSHTFIRIFTAAHNQDVVPSSEVLQNETVILNIPRFIQI